ncbi:MAG: glycosyltransferase family 2 protein [Legionella sp.]|uniref:glycosyltransferase family 2 protein n=1 Tax=Legionella sp. TaxID=459 RepID=UPI0039E256C1
MKDEMKRFGLELAKKIKAIQPRIGNLNQYPARHLSIEKRKPILSSKFPPKISIVTPSFSQGNYIAKTIESVLSQQYPNLEYFIQDGASKDNTVAVLRQYESQLSGWHSEADTGQAQAINRGFLHTTGELMGWLNSDDLLLPGTLIHIANYFTQNPKIDVVYGNRLLIDEQEMEIGRWILPGHNSKVLSWTDYIPQETLFWRRSIWNKIGGHIDESFQFAMDWDLLLRFRDVGARFAHIPRFLGAFRIHKHQKTNAAINEIGFKEMTYLRTRTLGCTPSKKEIRKAVIPFLIQHVMVDLLFHVKKQLKLF